MSTQPRFSPDRRFWAAAFSAALHLGALAALLLWHFSPTAPDSRAAMTVIDLPDRPAPEEPPPPPPPQPPQPRATPGTAKSGKAGPPAASAKAAPLAVALPLTVPTFAPAPVPSTGNQTSSGAAQAGTGTGAGGAGNGSGGGGNGNGGSGGDPQREGTEPRIVRGDFKPSDYPKALREARPKGRTWTEVMVGTNGRPLSCRVERSSGTPLLDTETCRIIMQRFRFRAGLDANRKAVVAPFYIDIAWELLDLNEE